MSPKLHTKKMRDGTSTLLVLGLWNPLSLFISGAATVDNTNNTTTANRKRQLQRLMMMLLCIAMPVWFTRISIRVSDKPWSSGRREETLCLYLVRHEVRVPLGRGSNPTTDRIRSLSVWSPNVGIHPRISLTWWRTCSSNIDGYNPLVKCHQIVLLSAIM